MTRSISLFFLAFIVILAPAQTIRTPARKSASGHPATTTPAPEKPAPPTEFPIVSINVEGNRILTPAGIAAASGLKPGQKGDTAVFDAARDRLLATGYFETVAYRFKSSDKSSGYDLSFEIEEMQPLYPLQIESLPVNAAEAAQFLKEKDPLFTGRIPGTQQVLDRTAREIEQYLAAKKTPQPVGGKVVLVANQQYVARFMPAKGLPNVGLVSFEGNKVVGNIALQNAIAAVAFGQPYTEPNFRLLLDNQVRPLYEKSGYMRVRFTKITTSPSDKFEALNVHVALEEGEQFKLGTVTVRGPLEDQSKHILRVAKVPAMTIPDFDQFREAAVRIKNGLRHEGYLDVDVITDREILDDTKTVNVWFNPQPGPQYSFGKLEVKGLGIEGLNAVNKAWTVKTGDPYPAEYPDYFLKRVSEDGWFDNLGQTRAEPEINAETHVVNVTLYFRYESDLRKKRPNPQDPQQAGGYPPI